jgi:ligand-binding sensor domain-containing protein
MMLGDCKNTTVMRFVARRMLKGQGSHLLGAVWLSIAILVVNVSAAASDKIGGYFDVSAVEEGWQPSTVTSLVQDHDGYVWVGTYNGLLRYDGVRFTVFDYGNTGGLRNGRITSLYEDSDGILWIGHETGELSRLVNGVFEPVSFGKSWPGGAIEAISSDENRDVWLVAGNGLLYRLRDAGTVESPGGGSATRKTLLLRTRTGQLWIIANGQVATLDRGRSKHPPF